MKFKKIENFTEKFLVIFLKNLQTRFHPQSNISQQSQGQYQSTSNKHFSFFSK